MKYSNDENT